MSRAHPRSRRPSGTHRDTIPSAPLQAFAPVFSTGQLIAGQYEVRALLGSGAMGQVYEAHDQRLNRRVALKIATGGEESLGALRREGQALAAIRHASVVTVHAMGTHDGADFLVMERVPGVTLEAMLEQRRRRGERVPLEEALEILVAITEGLAVVHRAGVAHRDVKPANVMLAAGGRVVLMDFGLMLPQIEAPGASELAGSHDYMAPEALTSRVGVGDAHLLDLYALGVTAFQILEGVLPFAGGELRAELPPALRDLVRSLTAKDPADRPQTAEAVLGQLRGARDRRPSGPAPPSFSVLLVGDAEALPLIVTAALPNAQLELVKEGAAALRLMKKRIPSLLLVDLALPDMSGAEVCMYLRGLERGSTTVIVALGQSDAGREGRDPKSGLTAANAALLRQLGVRFLEKGPTLISGLAALFEEINPAART